MNTWITSDLHLGHKNIIDYDILPFKSVAEMDDVIINNWNSIVREDDKVYILGDFAITGRIETFSYFARLNGHIYMLCNPWHHDKYFHFGMNIEKFLVTSKTNYIVSFEQPIVVIDSGIVRNNYKVPVVLCHYPIQVWDRKHYLSFHLYGHIHNQDFEIPNSPLSYNVAMVRNDFYPISLDKIVKVLESRVETYKLKSITEEG